MISVAIAFLPVAFISGMFVATYSDRRYWRAHGYCSVCFRLEDR